MIELAVQFNFGSLLFLSVGNGDSSRRIVASELFEFSSFSVISDCLQSIITMVALFDNFISNSGGVAWWCGL